MSPHGRAHTDFLSLFQIFKRAATIVIFHILQKESLLYPIFCHLQRNLE